MMKWMAVLPLLAAGVAICQMPGKVEWSAAAHSPEGNGRRVVVLSADVSSGWHVYAQTQEAGGPLPLVIKIEPGSAYEIAGAIKGTVPRKHHDASFNLDTEFYTDKFSLNVPVKVTNKANESEIPLSVRYQMCSEITCMPPKTVHLLAKAE